jgi:hypothetical protein
MDWNSKGESNQQVASAERLMAFLLPAVNKRRSMPNRLIASCAPKPGAMTPMLPTMDVSATAV